MRLLPIFLIFAMIAISQASMPDLIWKAPPQVVDVRNVDPVSAKNMAIANGNIADWNPRDEIPDYGKLYSGKKDTTQGTYETVDKTQLSFLNATPVNLTETSIGPTENSSNFTVINSTYVWY